MMRNPSRIQGISARIQDARKAVAEGASEREEKAAVIDLADRVNEAVANEAEPVAPSQEAASQVSQLLQEIQRPWMLLTILLGSGAENIRGEERQRLAGLIIEGAENVLHYWLTELSELNFGELKERLLLDEELRAGSAALEEADYKHLVTGFMDFIEFMIMSSPVERVLSLILEQAHHGIIGHSLDKTEMHSRLAKLIKGLWLTDIGAPNGRRCLAEAISGLGNAPFLRLTLVTFLVIRVKWSSSVKATRVALLDAAEALLRPMNRSIDKGELLRIIDHRPEDGSSSAAD